MSATQGDATPGDPRPEGAAPQGAAPSRAYWPVPLARAVPAGILGLYVTFSADHSARLGLVLFGAFALVSGALLLLLRGRFADRVVRGNFVVQGTLAALLGALALAFNGGGLGMLLLLLPAFMAITGFLELYSGLRWRRHAAAKQELIGARDLLAAGAFTAAMALVFLLIPQDSVLAIGLLGAYCILLCVYLAIGSLSLKWGTQNVRGANASAERTN